MYFPCMKQQIRILGIDDAPFTFHEKYTTVIGVIMRGGSYLEAVLSKQLTIDGTEATDIIIEMVQQTRHRPQIKAIMIDGVTLGGFNVVDITRLQKTVQIPVITITRDQPDFSTIKKALMKNFKDWEERWDILMTGPLYCVPTKHNPIFIKCAGISLETAKEIINISTIRGVVPEPVRIAHIIAAGVTRGESYGKA